ncbi:NAD-dependent protein deacylase SRT2-like [Tripterygium wilfordii]|uniref:NAD-dependent protein deacylase SRT2-like n=1 Tax=Tripterygium wilfordii TaxID=458696 RepID=UPI0018F822D6|nr:NAD-dependent protein deacylase SRT2-like [Tripterygium wilfordii]
MRDRGTQLHYWTSSSASYRAFSDVMKPNNISYDLAKLQKVKKIKLEDRAGCRAFELHGLALDVECMMCNRTMRGDDVQNRIRISNPQWMIEIDNMDIVFPTDFIYATMYQIPEYRESVKKFGIQPRCSIPTCQGLFKPKVFPEKARKMMGDCDVLLVLGLSLRASNAYKLASEALKKEERGGCHNRHNGFGPPAP